MGGFIKAASGKKPGDIFATSAMAAPKNSLPLCGLMLKVADYPALFEKCGYRYANPALPEWFRIPGLTGFAGFAPGMADRTNPAALETFLPPLGASISSYINTWYPELDFSVPNTHFHLVGNAPAADAGSMIIRETDGGKYFLPVVIGYFAGTPSIWKIKFGMSGRSTPSDAWAYFDEPVNYMRQCVATFWAGRGLTGAGHSVWEVVQREGDGAAPTNTPVPGDPSGSVTAAGIMIAAALLIDYAADTVALMIDGETYPVGALETNNVYSAGNGLYPYFGAEGVDTDAAIGFQLQTPSMDEIYAGIIHPLTGADVAGPFRALLAAGYINVIDHFQASNDAVLWCIQAK